jgi:hypothetical protein
MRWRLSRTARSGVPTMAKSRTDPRKDIDFHVDRVRVDP